MTWPHLGRDALAALWIVREAIELLRDVQPQVRGAAFVKIDASPVTIADLAIQAIVTARLVRAVPGDSLVSEEDASWLRGDGQRSQSEVVDLVRRVIPHARTEAVLEWIDSGKGEPRRRFWTLDPIDGTKGFLHDRQYVIALALIVDGAVAVGAIGCPRLSLFAASGSLVNRRAAYGGVALAVRNEGAWWIPAANDRPLRLAVSSRADGGEARVLRSYEEEHGDVARFDRALRTFGSRTPPLLMDSQAKHVVLAAGEAELLMRFPARRDFHDAIWDYAAGSLLVEEAGGRVSDLAGHPLDFTAGRRLLRNEGILVSNGRLHGAALLAIQQAGWRPNRGRL
jgi:3'(2'), 5'-bisphosphate nucleotidase